MVVYWTVMIVIVVVAVVVVVVVSVVFVCDRTSTISNSIFFKAILNF